MKKLTFKVSSEKEQSVVSLIKKVNTISCRIYIDLEKGYVTVENVNEDMIDNVIDLVDNYYSILSVDIDNTAENQTENSKDSGNESSTMQTTSEEKTSETREAIPAEPMILEPQSEDDLIIKKVEFENKYIEEVINKLMRSAYWAMFQKNISEQDIADHLYTCLDEISMKYGSKESIEFEIGDIVECNFGTHLPGEINGRYVHSIVCDILTKDMAYIVPVTKSVYNTAHSRYCLSFSAPDDVIYKDNFIKGGNALINKGKCVRVERFKSVVGKTTNKFFNKVLYSLSSAFDFTDNCIDEDNTDEEVITEDVADAEENVEDFDTGLEETTNNIAGKETETDETAHELKKVTTKMGGEESALCEAIGPAFKKLDKSLSISEQITSFMEDIGMDNTNKLVAQSFEVACDIKRINYENVILELHNLNPDIREEIIKTSLRDCFKSWLEMYPELAEKCPRISLMSLLKAFVKRAI